MIAAIHPTIARLFLIIALCLCTEAVQATAFTAKRGISMDQWVTWPSIDRWNDGDVLDNFPEWKKFVTDSELAALTRHGFTTIRIPIDPAIFLHNDDPVRQRRLLSGVADAIDRVIRTGANVIVDLHTIPYGDKPASGISKILNDDLTFIAYKALVGDMAEAVKTYDAGSVALELINEPQYACDEADTAPLWQAQLTQLHAAARAANEAITIIMPGACYGSAEGLDKLDPEVFNDENIIWSFHSYEPFILTHQSANWAGKPVSAFQNLPYPPSRLDQTSIEGLPSENRRQIDASLSGMARTNAAWYIRNEFESWGSDAQLKTHLEEPFRVAADWADKHGISRDRVFLGEFGFIAQEYGKAFATDPQWRLAYLDDMISLAEKYGFGWSIWSYGGAFGMAQTFGGEPMPGDLMERLNLLKAN